MRLKDKVAIVTGAAQGIGYGIAKKFSEEGASVVLVDINGEKGRTITSNIPNAIFVPCDVTQKSQVDNVIEEALKHYGKIDICVNSAAILKTGEVLEYSEEDFDAVMNTNLKGSFLMSQACAKEMVKENTRGSIINLSSINAKVCIPNAIAYNVSKGAINQLTTTMGVALAQSNIRVNSIGPGSVQTEMLKENLLINEDMKNTVLSRTPMGRIGEVDEIANVAVFLASDDASYITGQCIYADGGRLGLNYMVPIIETEDEDEI